MPLLLAGDGIPAGKKVSVNTSIMDIGPTLCELAGCRYEGHFVDGVSLVQHMMRSDDMPNIRPVISQYIESRGGGRSDPNSKAELAYGVMVRRGEWKYIEYHGCEDQAVLFNLQTDPGEAQNLCLQCPQIAQELQELAMLATDPLVAEMEHRGREQMRKWLQAYEATAGLMTANDGKTIPARPVAKMCILN